MKVFEIRMEDRIIMRGSEAKCRDVWSSIITGSLDVGFSGKVELVKVIAENKLPIEPVGSD